MPIFHIIGNVTTDDETGAVTSVEDINDVSSVFLWKGVYHVMHQCCQNHWDHIVSKDLIHWTRLPPPIVPNMNPTGVPHADSYDAFGSWDGSLSVPHDWNGITEPVVLMTACAKAWCAGGVDAVGMAVVRPTRSSDPFLVSWTKDQANPVEFANGSAIDSAYDTPGQIWKNGDHWNFLVVGERYTSKDPSFHTWRRVENETWPTGETGGQWFSPLAPLADGSKPPAGAPSWMMSVGNGGKYALGEYDPASESWTTVSDGLTVDYGPSSAWEVGQFAGGRFMNIGWINQGPPMANERRAGTEGRDQMTYPHETAFGFTQLPAGAGIGGCEFTRSWEVLPGFTNIYNRMPSPTNQTHGSLIFIGLFDSAVECFAAVNKTSSTGGPFHSFTYNDASVASADYARHCWADTSFTWQNRGPGYDGQVSGRGPGFPLTPPIPSGFTHDHLSGLRQVSYDPALGTLISNPVKELAGLRNGTLASEKGVSVVVGSPHVIAGTGAPHDASTADVLLTIAVPRPTRGGNGSRAGAAVASAVGVSVLANVSGGVPFGGVLTILNFSAPDANGSLTALASIRTLNPCGSGSEGLTHASFAILANETLLDIRILVDRSIVEVFIMGGRVVFSKTYSPSVLYVPDTHVAVHAWGDVSPLTLASADVFSMGCGWTDPPYQPNPTM